MKLYFDNTMVFKSIESMSSRLIWRSKSEPVNLASSDEHLRVRFWHAVKVVLLVWLIQATHMIALSSAYADSPTQETPRLMVVVSVDQFCQDYLIRFQNNFSDKPGESLFRSILAQGAWYSNCHHQHAFTFTAPGHSVQLSGAYPSTSGVIDNDWFDRTSGKTRYCVSDSTVKSVGLPKGKPMSPRVMLVDTVGDRLKLATNGKAKVIGISIKDRAAVLMSGHLADAAYWLEDNLWVTSSYYRKDLPGYLRNMNDGNAIDQFRGKTWELLYPTEKYHNIGNDDSPHENPPKGFTAAFPHELEKVGEGTADSFGDHVLYSPYGNDYTLQTACEIIEFEKLGDDDIPDLLNISFSSNDYVGHAFGPLSYEVEDMTYRTDRQLAEFAKFLDKKVGEGRWTLALTSDHGVAPIPELVAERTGPSEQAIPGKRNPLGNLKELRERLEALVRNELKIDAAAEDDEAKVIVHLEANQVYLNHDHAELNGERSIAAQILIRDWLLKQPLVAAAATREELLGNGQGKLLEQMRLSFHPDRSGDVLFVYTPYAIPGSASASSKPKGTTHGSPWHYDTHVPLLLIGHGIKPGHYDRRVSPAMLAPTVSRLLQVDSPGGCVEEPLQEALLPVAKF
jgi:predicted AlkP superfamily pyrophosphatase or phosphodiesterase